MLKHNSYFDGAVQSVGYERNGMRATVGVIAPGEHHFGTAAAERMTVVSGLLQAKLPGGYHTRLTMEFDIYDREQDLFLSTARRRQLLAGLPVDVQFINFR